MDLDDLTARQAGELANRLQPMLGYLTRLTNRMQERGWRAHDPVYVAAWEARDALHEVLVRVRYAACGPGRAGKPSEPPPPSGERPRRPWEPGGSGRDGA